MASGAERGPVLCTALGSCAERLQPHLFPPRAVQPCLWSTVRAALLLSCPSARHLHPSCLLCSLGTRRPPPCCIHILGPSALPWHWTLCSWGTAAPLAHTSWRVAAQGPSPIARDSLCLSWPHLQQFQGQDSGFLTILSWQGQRDLPLHGANPSCFFFFGENQTKLPV